MWDRCPTTGTCRTSTTSRTSPPGPSSWPSTSAAGMGARPGVPASDFWLCARTTRNTGRSARPSSRESRERDSTLVRAPPDALGRDGVLRGPGVRPGLAGAAPAGPAGADPRRSRRGGPDPPARRRRARLPDDGVRGDRVGHERGRDGDEGRRSVHHPGMAVQPGDPAQVADRVEGVLRGSDPVRRMVRDLRDPRLRRGHLPGAPLHVSAARDRRHHGLFGRGRRAEGARGVRGDRHMDLDLHDHRPDAVLPGHVQRGARAGR